MAGRLTPGLPKSFDVSSLSLETAGVRRRKRTFAAFMTGAALFAAGWVALQSNLAGAASGHGLLSSLSAALDPVDAASATTPRLVEVPIDPTTPTRQSSRKRRAATMAAARRPVCVRLCDGFFFPINSSAANSSVPGEEAACAGLCPDAPTALYFLPARSDKIEQAALANGERYSALPVSFRYRTTYDRTCTCHRDAAQIPPYWQDPTLRKGDAVMTPSGFAVFRGAGASPYRPEDFATLAAAPMPGDRRAGLTAIERVSVLPARDGDRSRIAEVAPKLSTDPLGANTIRFAEPPISATN